MDFRSELYKKGNPIWVMWQSNQKRDKLTKRREERKKGERVGMRKGGKMKMILSNIYIYLAT